MRRLLWIVPLVALVLLIGLRIRQKSAGSDEAKGGPKAEGKGGGKGKGKPQSVEAALVGPHTFEKAVEAVGTAVSPQTVRLSPPVSGRITYLQAREGDAVKAGETLVRIDPSQIQGTVLQNRAAISEAQARLAQAQATLGSQDVALTSAIRTQKAAVQSAQASLGQAKRTRSAQVSAAQAVVDQQAAAVRAAQAAVASAQAQEEAAKGTLKANQSRLDRTEGLFKGGFIAAQDVDDARATVATALGGVRIAQQAEASARADVAQARAQEAAARAGVVVAQRETQGAILTAEANLRSAQAALASANANVAQRGANQRNLQALQASVDAAQGQLTATQAQLANTELKSPIDGTVSLRSADSGSLAQPGTPVLTIQVVKRMFVESAFPIELATRLKAGDEASVSFENLPDRKFTGKIVDLNRAADPTSRQFTVRVLLDNPEETIRAGMFGRVRVVTQKTDASLAVPLGAVDEKEGKATVSTVGKDGVVENKRVTLGQRDETSVEILGGLRAGERVVTTKGKPIKDGSKVSVNSPEEKP